MVNFHGFGRTLNAGFLPQFPCSFYTSVFRAPGMLSRIYGACSDAEKTGGSVLTPFSPEPVLV